MNICLNIEKLICYAKINLLLDEADEIYVRNGIMQKLGLEKAEAYEVNEDEIEQLSDPFSLLELLFAYALEKGKYTESERELFNAEIMDIVSLRPGEIEDTFESLSKNPTKALEWAHDYAVKNGSAKTEFNRWENKGDYNIEVVFDECDCAAQSCPFCIENEGYGVHRNERFIELPIGDSWYYRAARHTYFEGMGHIVSAKHKAMPVNEETLNVMFDFVEISPTMFVFTGECDKHAHFICGTKALPVHKAAEKRKFKNKEYPYINIAETEWYLNTLKLSCTNREKLLEFTLKLINSYKREKGGKVLVSVRKIESKFTVDLIMVSADKKECGLAKADMLAYVGVFRIGKTVESQLKTIEKYLTKEIRFTPMCLMGGMEAHAKMIDALLKEVGTSQLGAVEAALDVKEECKKTLVAFLGEAKTFDDNAIEKFAE